MKAKDGEWTWCAMMCDSVAPAYERRNVAEELKTKPYNARFIDTTVAAPWQTCRNPGEFFETVAFCMVPKLTVRGGLWYNAQHENGT